MPGLSLTRSCLSLPVQLGVDRFWLPEPNAGSVRVASA
jgi:hypothetical protein